MSEDETTVLIMAVVVGAMLAVRWAGPILLGRTAGFAIPERIGLGLAPLAGLAIIYVVLVTAASGDVRNDPSYIFFYCVLGLTWTLAAGVGLEYLGISFRDDGVERRNTAAAVLVSAVVLAQAAIYAGANIGNGPGWWTVIEAGGIGAIAWTAMWLTGELVCGWSEDITVDRDVQASLRLGAYAIAMGAICARGAAGDWTSLEQTIREFWVAWPVVPLTLVVIGLERLLERLEMHYRRGYAVSLVLAVLYLAAGGFAVMSSGPLPHNPQYDYLNKAQ